MSSKQCYRVLKEGEIVQWTDRFYQKEYDYWRYVWGEWIGQEKNKEMPLVIRPIDSFVDAPVPKRREVYRDGALFREVLKGDPPNDP